ncbi:MAG: RIO1 family regulatory kinase/ATPase domain-containing protein [Candidatus Hodarchaeales archaeon]
MSLKVMKNFQQLRKRDFKVMTAIERLMINHQYAPVEEISSFTGFSEQLVNSILTKLNKLDLITFWRHGHYDGVELLFNAYDALALRSLSQSDTITGIGGPLGVGKEADIILGESKSGPVAVKIHRLGKHNFRDTKRKRGYIAGKKHISRLYESRLAAQHEFKALSKLHAAGIAVPKPEGQNRHIIVMEYIDGRDLQKCRSLPVDTYRMIFSKVMENIRGSFNLGIIHADLSEYNIMLTGDNQPVIIDWPQWIPVDHENARDILKRDLNNLSVFFSKRKVPDEDMAELYTKLGLTDSV